MIRKTGLVWLLLLFCTAVRASNLRQISSREGISNNAILSLAQDKHGFIWVGSAKMPAQGCLARICTISSWIRTADSPAFSNFVSENPKPV